VSSTPPGRKAARTPVGAGTPRLSSPFLTRAGTPRYQPGPSQVFSPPLSWRAWVHRYGHTGAQGSPTALPPCPLPPAPLPGRTPPPSWRAWPGCRHGHTWAHRSTLSLSRPLPLAPCPLPRFQDAHLPAGVPAAGAVGDPAPWTRPLSKPPAGGACSALPLEGVRGLRSSGAASSPAGMVQDTHSIIASRYAGGTYCTEIGAHTVPLPASTYRKHSTNASRCVHT